MLAQIRNIEFDENVLTFDIKPNNETDLHIVIYTVYITMPNKNQHKMWCIGRIGTDWEYKIIGIDLNTHTISYHEKKYDMKIGVSYSLYNGFYQTLELPLEQVKELLVNLDYAIID